MEPRERKKNMPWLEDAWEQAVYRGSVIAMKGGFASIDVDYMAIRDYAEDYGLERIELLNIAKRLAAVFGEKHE